MKPDTLQHLRGLFNELTDRRKAASEALLARERVLRGAETSLREAEQAYARAARDSEEAQERHADLRDFRDSIVGTNGVGVVTEDLNRLASECVEKSRAKDAAGAALDARRGEAVKARADHVMAQDQYQWLCSERDGLAAHIKAAENQSAEAEAPPPEPDTDH
ncbi:MAG TPA: hypothetical protein VEC38_05360 [Candidatus Binataceae bacterium]|nr:hypothetical protein [Candidatus Binataceae bacterium]